MYFLSSYPSLLSKLPLCFLLLGLSCLIWILLPGVSSQYGICLKSPLCSSTDKPFLLSLEGSDNLVPTYFFLHFCCYSQISLPFSPVIACWFFSGAGGEFSSSKGHQEPSWFSCFFLHSCWYHSGLVVCLYLLMVIYCYLVFPQILL